MNRALGTSIGVLVLVAAATGQAWAMSMDQAMAQCREQYSPQVRACVGQKMQATRGQGDREKFIAECRAPVVPQVRACVAKLTGASGLHNLPTNEAREAPKETPKLAAGRPRTAPPRTISDITAILDQEKPDPARTKRLQAAADAREPGGDAVAKAHFYNGRGLARAELGRNREAAEDSERAVALGQGKVDAAVINNFRNMLALQHMSSGEPKLALDVYMKMIAESETSSSKGFLFIAYRQVCNIYLALGDLERAQSYVQKAEALWKTASSIRGYADHGPNWQASVEDGRGKVLEARGQHQEALKSYELSERLRRGNIDKSARAFIAVPRTTLEQAADLQLASVARAKARLGRLVEAETDARRALLNRLHATGKYAPNTARYIAGLGTLLVEQGRYDEAKKLISAAVDIFREVGVPEDSQIYVSAMSDLAAVQALQGQWTEADGSYATIVRATEQWEPRRRGPYLTNLGRIETLYRNDRLNDGLTVGRRLLDFRIERYGEQHPETALARGVYAVGLALAKRDDEARKEFQTAVPVLTATNFNTDNDDAITAAARARYTQVIVENYMVLLARVGAVGGTDVANDTFRLADSVRGRSVQKALTAAGARMTTSDPNLAAALRQEQDLRQQVGAQLGQLNSLLALPAGQRDDAGVAAMRKDIDKMRADHTKVRADIDRRFPEYAELIDPKPPTTAQIRQMLKPGEALLSFYFGRDASFVWAVAEDGKVEFAQLREDATAVEQKIKKLRESLEPQAALVSDIPAFDLALAHELFKTLLEPVKPVWGDAKSLIVVTNGALGLLPLSLLTTAPHELSKDGIYFAGYRAAPWLARTHAVTMVPSASALGTLRRLPPGSPKRKTLIAFGDPWFSAEQAAEAAKEVKVADAGVQTRGLPLKLRAAVRTEGIDSAMLAQLPRLPDTADEVRSVALALQADPTQALFLGKDANEQVIKKTDLSGFKIVAFATHGLVPGELDGLDQPALALTAPNVAGVEGDGLLTMQEILSLKLDADWVVLSACNTGAGAGAGAEAASGLGRAFFYAGTRAILVTNWAVQSESARELVTDLFARQAADAKLSRGEALRQAMMALMDGKGATDEKGQTVFTYGHPLFWAPYSVIGDGG